MSAIIKADGMAMCRDCKQETTLFASCFKNAVTWCSTCQKDISLVVVVGGDTYKLNKATKIKAR